jgi:hypothetical protein
LNEVAKDFNTELQTHDCALIALQGPKAQEVKGKRKEKRRGGREEREEEKLGKMSERMWKRKEKTHIGCGKKGK